MLLPRVLAELPPPAPDPCLVSAVSNVSNGDVTSPSPASALCSVVTAKLPEFPLTKLT